MNNDDYIYSFELPILFSELYIEDNLELAKEIVEIKFYEFPMEFFGTLYTIIDTLFKQTNFDHFFGELLLFYFKIYKEEKELKLKY